MKDGMNDVVGSERGERLVEKREKRGRVGGVIGEAGW